MSFPITNNQVYRVTYDLTMFGQKLMNTFSYRVGVIGSEPDTDTLCDNIETVLSGLTNLEAKYRACLPPQVTIANTWIQVIYPTRIRKKVYVRNLAGLWTGVALTANTAVSIERFGAVANRHNIGRVQLPSGDDVTSMNNGLVAAGAYTTALTALATQIPANLSTIGGTVMNPVLVQSPVNANYNYITGANLQPTMRVMRRRTVGVGK